jgi:hypothetical protein
LGFPSIKSKPENVKGVYQKKEAPAGWVRHPSVLPKGRAGRGRAAQEGDPALARGGTHPANKEEGGGSE